MTNELKPETLSKKRRETESLDDFLGRMAIVWHERQKRLEVEMQRRRDRANAFNARAKAADPEGYARKRKEAARRYAERHPDRIRAKERRASLRRADSRKAKLIESAEGYPKPLPPLSETELFPARAKPSPRVDDPTRALFGHATPSVTRPDQKKTPASATNTPGAMTNIQRTNDDRANCRA